MRKSLEDAQFELKTALGKAIVKNGKTLVEISQEAAEGLLYGFGYVRSLEDRIATLERTLEDNGIYD